jgi:hypothetical protein
MASSLAGVLFGVKVEVLGDGLVPSLFRHVVGSLAAVGIVGVGLVATRHCFFFGADSFSFKKDLTDLMVRAGPTAVALTVLAGHVMETDYGVKYRFFC